MNLGLLFLRLGLGGVFLWFGVDKFFNPMLWAGFVPDWFTLMPQETTMYIMGVVESTLGVCLIIGWFTRYAAAVCAASLFVICLTLGYNEIMIRDAGLFFLALGINRLGAGAYSVDSTRGVI